MSRSIRICRAPIARPRRSGAKYCCSMEAASSRQTLAWRGRWPGRLEGRGRGESFAFVFYLFNREKG
eukprot:scaffold5668_cov111-Isochrysis_galbana.AAC.24